jgi:catechol 2,3-dioxygenase-like lactoylglutathione lyase family enzyme
MNFTLTLAVRDIEHTERFYRDVLQFAIERFVPAKGHPPVLLLERGGASLLFREKEVLEALHPAIFQHLDRHPVGTGLTIEFTVSDLRPISKAIFRREWPILYELQDDEFNRRELWLHDPDGYVIVLTQEG